VAALDGNELRQRLTNAHLLLVFTPELCGGRDPLEVLEAALPHVDLVQVRTKAAAVTSSDAIAADPPAAARATYDWTARVLDLCDAHPDAPPVTVNDRVDVALALRERGCAGVHLGQHDFPPAEARALLGAQPLIGLSTHDQGQVAGADELPVDYLGFGPAYVSSTKGYARGRGPEACWIAANGSTRPLFPIGGITRENAIELENVARAAVSSAVLCAPDPGRAARELRHLLTGDQSSNIASP
jgi:thiamine-phosphate pyrophosphorylase